MSFRSKVALAVRNAEFQYDGDKSRTPCKARAFSYAISAVQIAPLLSAAGVTTFDL